MTAMTTAAARTTATAVAMSFLEMGLVVGDLGREREEMLAGTEEEVVVVEVGEGGGGGGDG